MKSLIVKINLENANVKHTKINKKFHLNIKLFRGLVISNINFSLSIIILAKIEMNL